MKRYIVFDLAGRSFLVDTRYVLEVTRQDKIILVPNLRFPFESLLIRQERAFPVIYLDKLLNESKQAEYHYILVQNKKKRIFCIQTSSLPRIVQMTLPKKTSTPLTGFNEFVIGGQIFYLILPVECFFLDQIDLRHLQQKIDGGTGI